MIFSIRKGKGGLLNLMFWLLQPARLAAVAAQLLVVYSNCTVVCPAYPLVKAQCV